MRITLCPVIFLLTAVIFLSICNGAAYAYENDIGISRIDPSSPIYFLKAIRENIENALAITPRVKLIRQLEFATRRLREAKALVSAGRQDLIEATLERYWFHISNLLDKTLPAGRQGLKDEELLLRIKESLGVHLKTLELIYAEVSDPGAKRAIRSALNKIVDNTTIPNSARLTVCNLFAYEASTAANLSETEKVILMERAQKCFHIPADLK